MERVLILLERQYENQKTKNLALLYAAFVNEKISWSRFCEYADIIERMFISDFETLNEIYVENGLHDLAKLSYIHTRLNSLGLVNLLQYMGGSVYYKNADGSPNAYLNLTDLGKTLCEIIFGACTEH